MKFSCHPEIIRRSCSHVCGDAANRGHTADMQGGHTGTHQGGAAETCEGHMGSRHIERGIWRGVHGWQTHRGTYGQGTWTVTLEDNKWESGTQPRLHECGLGWADAFTRHSSSPNASGLPHLLPSRAPVALTCTCCPHAPGLPSHARMSAAASWPQSSVANQVALRY